MPQIIILGSSNAVPDEKHENTHMAVVSNGRVVLIDCVNNATVRLKQAGLKLNEISDLILTHFHPDHVSGVPSLLMNSWLLGRTSMLRIHGLSHALDRLEELMNAYEWRAWPNFFPVEFHPLPEEEMCTVLDDADYRFFSSPVHHLIPTIGLRMEFNQTGRVAAYSCDTEPCQEVVTLASGADLLIHEATGASIGHSSATQAGAIAREAEVGRLLLIHYPVVNFNYEALPAEASTTYGGDVKLAEDFMHIEI
jgi:ribonuclease Z